eukprot:3048206-Karenia_brevis.AAC.1
MDRVIQDARRSRRLPIIAGDWNAEIGGQKLGDEGGAVGQHGQGLRNARGQWFATWASTSSLRITNTFFRKRWDKLWTHVQNNRERVIDYICVDERMRKWVTDVE